MVAAPATFLVPTSPVPVPPQIWCLLGHHDQVTDTCIDDRFASGAEVRLACLVRLDGLNDLAGDPIKGRQIDANWREVLGHGRMLRHRVPNR